MKKVFQSIKQVFQNTNKIIEKNWELDLHEGILCSPTFIDYKDQSDCILIGTRAGELLLLDNTGILKWKFEAKESLSDQEMLFFDSEQLNSINAKPFVGEINETTRIIFGTENGILFCLNKDGETQWSMKTGGPIRSTPLIADIEHNSTQQILISSHDGFIYIISDNGELIKKIGVGSPIETTPTIIDEKIIVGTRAGEVIAVNKEGRIIWKYTTEDRITAKIISTELYANGKQTILVGSHDNTLYALSSEGEAIWTFATKGAIIAAPIIYSIKKTKTKTIIFGSCDNMIYCLNESGELLWNYETGFWIATSPLLITNQKQEKTTILAGSYDHTVYLLDGEGSYELEYIPGLTGIINQSGQQTSSLSKEVGNNQGKKIAEFETDGNIVGCAHSLRRNEAIITTKQGKIYSLKI